MIKTARHARGLTLADLAGKTGIDKGMLSKIETGLARINTDHIKAISSNLNYPLNFFYVCSTEGRYSDFFYRKRVKMPVKEKEKIDAQIDVLRIMYERLLNLADIPEPKIMNMAPSGALTPERIAEIARDFYKIGKGPIQNLINIIEKHGIAVLYLDTDSEQFDGVTAYSDNGYPMIVLNKNKPNDRKRFTLAHELGHMIMHFPYRFNPNFYDKMENEKDDVFEREADRFASEFLLPASDVFQSLQHITYGRLGLLKEYWNVSKSALIRRAKTLNCINATRYSSLMIELSRNGERKNETGEVNLDTPQLFRKLIEAGMLDLTEYDLAEYTCVAHDDLKQQNILYSSGKLKIVV
ncbi:MAG: ImmA/IrrE family metallo-endopeptidase [Chitinophagales bacterium]